MTLCFATEARFVKSEGKYYSLGGFGKGLWERYLEHFDELVVIARVSEDGNMIGEDAALASSDRVRFIELPYYIGFNGYLKNKRKIRRLISASINKDFCYICRLPGQIGGILSGILRRKGIPYACEVVGNPWDVFARGSVTHPLRPLIRMMATISLKYQVRRASACLYVTRKTLQRMYPAGESAFSVGVSDVIVSDNDFAASPKVMESKDSYTIVSIGSLDQMYKAPDVLLKAMMLLKQKGINTRLLWMGDGKYRPDMVRLAEKMNVDAFFTGNLPREKVHSELEDADMFVLVSRTEGLPRAVIEAMAHGLPCIGTRVGGIPELLEDTVLIDKDEPLQLAGKIEKMIKDHDFADRQAQRNLMTARYFKEERLKQLRAGFFEYIKKQHSVR